MRTAKGLGSPFVVVEAIVRYQVQFLNLNLMCIFMTFDDVTLALWILYVDVTCVPLVECGNCANSNQGRPAKSEERATTERPGNAATKPSEVPRRSPACPRCVKI
jgi:hypothetical protein